MHSNPDKTNNTEIWKKTLSRGPSAIASSASDLDVFTIDCMVECLS